MATIEKFEDLRIWQQARELCIWYNSLVMKSGLKEDIKLRFQADGSSGSIMDNIAEGFERNGTKEFKQFLSIAKASAGEFRSQLYRIYDRGYIDKTELEIKLNDSIAISKGISAFIKYLNNNDYKGWKFSEPEAVYQQNADKPSTLDI